MSATKPVRCAIYTRKSTEEGLDQAFNSLHAQREACEAYIKSQVAEGWRALSTEYDDGGFSGGTMERPALKRLLNDVDAGRVDTIVVYKVDRLTRSLPDFAKIVERLDAAGASFVSVTQAFNTTSSMGRLTLNVLLSFAQFEREVTGERIRDKIAASKARGMWMGGQLPLGYDPPTDPRTRSLVVNVVEAEVVRDIFSRYLALGSVSALEADLRDRNVRSKTWVTRSGRTTGGAGFSRGALYHLLQNRLYLGEITHRGASYPGAHDPIVAVEVFEAVQAKLAKQRVDRRDRMMKVAPMPLRGLIFDAAGNPMSPSFAYGRGGRLYRYYVSAPLQQGRKLKGDAGAIRRVAAGEIEEIVRCELEVVLGEGPFAKLLEPVKRIVVEPEYLRVSLCRGFLRSDTAGQVSVDDRDSDLGILALPIRCRIRGGRSWIMRPPNSTRKARLDPVLIRGLQSAHRLASSFGWQAADGKLVNGKASAPANAYDRLLCRLVFLAPDIQRAILLGRQPADLTLQTLLSSVIPLAWDDQRSAFGFTAP